MSRALLTRIERLRALRERRRDEAVEAMGRALRLLESARQAESAAFTSWSGCAEEAVALDQRRAWDFELGRARLRSLAQVLRRTRDERHAAQLAYRQRRLAVLAAERELQRLDLWEHDVSERIGTEQARQERRETDELAARCAAGTRT